MRYDPTLDPQRDAFLGRSLRELDRDVPQPDWNRLRSSIRSEAELPLARLRRGERGPARSRRLIAAAAVVVALVGGLLVVRENPPPPPVAATSSHEPVVEEIVDASLPDQVAALISGEAAEDALLSAALGI